MSVFHLYINSISYPVTNLGPGKRVVLWVEGCSLKCKGCMALSMQYQRRNSIKHVHDIFLIIKQIAQHIGGITISGGEPFEQVDSLYELLRMIRQETNLDIMVYSGFTLEELRLKGNKINRLLRLIDILVDGRFEENNTNRKIWRGSDNQRVLFLNKNSRKFRHYANIEYDLERPLFYEVSEKNQLRIIGIPERGFLKNLENKFQEKGLHLY
jgi:anaerobic ribonucleoside-triphosphate reductase activating protein